MQFQAYLSLPEGTATVAGLIAMMTDHYSILVRFDKFRYCSGTTVAVNFTADADCRSCSFFVQILS